MATERRSRSLRKACQNCTAAKRRCIVTLPRCPRCSKKNLECCYDLEPLPAVTTGSGPQPPQWQGLQQSQSQSQPQPQPQATTISSTEAAAHCLLEKVISIDDQGWFRPRFPMHDDRPGIEYVLWVLHLIPSCVTAGKPSPFIHPKLRLSRSSISSHLSIAIGALRREPCVSPLYSPLQDLLRAKPGGDAIEDVLGAVQALVLYMLALLFGDDANGQTAAKSYFTQLIEWVALLETRAHNLTTQGLSPWQGWLFGESIRRTILVAHILICVYFPGRYNHPSEKLRMEALPFDGRPGLWLAESPQAWISAAAARRGEDVQTELASWHEFSSVRPRLPMGYDGDMFLAMMVVAHNGRE